MQQLPAAAGRPGQLELEGGASGLGTLRPNLCRSSCLTYLRRLGFAFKRPKKRLLNGILRGGVRRPAGGGIGSGAKIFFADEAHNASPGELQQSAVWRESQLLFGGVSGDGRGGMDGPGGKQQQRNLGSLFGPVAPEALWAAQVIWDNAPAHRGEAVREFEAWPGAEAGESAGLQPRLQRR